MKGKVRVVTAAPAEPTTRRFYGYLDAEAPQCPAGPTKGSFVGGLPLWASAAPEAPVTCSQCQQPMAQLAQIHAPLDHGLARRALHLFVCLSQGPCARAPGQWAAYRSQTRQEDHADDAGAAQEEAEQQEEKAAELAVPVEAPSPVGDSDNPFASLIALRDAREEQHAQQKKSKHKAARKAKRSTARALAVVPTAAQETAWTQAPLRAHWLDVVEAWATESSTRERDDAKLLRRYGVDREALLAELDADAGGKRGKDSWAGEGDEPPTSASAKWFDRFCAVAAEDPERILMYQHGGSCVWISDPATHLAVRPLCRRCGAACVFEVQLLPSLLFLGLEAGVWGAQAPVAAAVVAVAAAPDAVVEGADGVEHEANAPSAEELARVALLETANLSAVPEFGTLAVYTCSRSCDGSSALQEHIMVQLAL